MGGDQTGRTRDLVFWGAVAVSLAVSIVPLLTPKPQAADDPDAISIERAVAHVEAIAAEPRPMGSDEISAARMYLIGALRDAGAEPEIQRVRAPDYYGVPGRTVEVVNILARIPGRSGSTDAIVLTAHYDTTPSTPGANDNAAAVAALLEAARELVRNPADRDVIILLSDGEEPPPRFGATAFLDEHRWAPDVTLVVNLEAIGDAGPSALVEISGPTDPLVRALSETPGPTSSYSFLTETAELIGGAASDFDVFREADLPGYHFAYLRGSSIYHTERDDIASLNVDGMAHHGAMVLGIARSPVVEGTGDAVFAVLPFGIDLRFGIGWGVALSFAAGIAGTVLVIDRMRDSGTGSLAGGFGMMAVAVLGSLIPATVAWYIVSSVRPEMGAGEAVAWLCVLVGFVVAGWVVAHRWARRRGADDISAVLVVWITLALLVGTWRPAIGYLFVIPLLATSLVWLASRVARGAGWVLIGATVAGFGVLAIMVPAIDTFFLLANPRPGNPDSELPELVLIPLLLGFLAIALLDATRNALSPSSPHEVSISAAPDRRMVNEHRNG